MKIHARGVDFQCDAQVVTHHSSGSKLAGKTMHMLEEAS
jgi:hypothetical protein